VGGERGCGGAAVGVEQLLRVEGDGLEGVYGYKSGRDVGVDEIRCEAHAEVVQKAAGVKVLHFACGEIACSTRLPSVTSSIATRSSLCLHVVPAHSRHSNHAPPPPDCKNSCKSKRQRVLG
jgi:hypothetical protein